MTEEPSPTPDTQSDKEPLPLRLHPRVFAALGKDLVTNDVVAVMELVKNAYDAFAENVWIEFGVGRDDSPYLEIRDDGIGMTRDVIENVWCLVATPHRERNPIVKKGDQQRRVVGAKGLGRLSVARLGDRLQMLTKSDGQPAWSVEVNWSALSNTDTLEQSTVLLSEHQGASPLGSSGTRLRILGLENIWDKRQIEELRANLARLLSPFSLTNDFNIYMSISNSAEVIRVSSSEFLSNPKYLIKGKVDKNGVINASYSFSPIMEYGTARIKAIDLQWIHVRQSAPLDEREKYPIKRPRSGPFVFEIRAWDIGPNDTQEIADRFNIRKSLIRQAIKAHKGISVYRDGVLVLPKSENARDWLGLDLRRVGRVGPRLSTTQIVGYVAITAKDNPGIEDTSDRERLSSSNEVSDFQLILKAIVMTLENERNIDRVVPGRERPMNDLFAELDASELVSRISVMAASGATASETVPLIRNFEQNLENTRETIQNRFVYYSRLATVGTIAQYLLHEIRNRSTIINRAMRSVRQIIGTFAPKDVMKNLESASNSLKALEDLADRFAPLANRNFTRKPQCLVLEDRIRNSLQLSRIDLQEKEINCRVPSSETMVMVDPGELETILINLISNASFWLGQMDRKKRNIEFELISAIIGSNARVQVWVHDSGPGIEPDDVDLVFLPGVTRKPDGIGMGLNVAAELVAIYGGEMLAMREPTKLGGASFCFDLPLAMQDMEEKK